MKPLFIPVLFAALSVATAEPQKLLDSLRGALREEFLAQPAASNLNQVENLERLLYQLPSDTNGMSRSEQAEAVRILMQLEVFSQSPKVRDLCEALTVDLRNRSAQKAIDLKEKFTYVLRDALIRGLDAASAQEVDASLTIIAELDEQTKALNDDQARQRSQPTALQSVRYILFAYQDALMATSAMQKMPTRLSELPADKFRSTAIGHTALLAALIPRSELLEKIGAASQRLWPPTQNILSKEEFEKKLQDIIQGIKKIGDLEAAQAECNALIAHQREWGGYTMESTVTGSFRQYLEAYRDLRSGSTSLNFTNFAPSFGAEYLAGVRDLVFRFALPRVLQPPPGLTQKEDEPTAAYLQRVLAAARSSADWPLFSRTLEVAQSTKLSAVANSTDVGAFRLFLGGFNQEQAHYLSGAVSSYLDALRFGSRIIPVEYIGQHLQAIRRQSPQDYEAGAQMSLKTVHTSSPSLSDSRTTRIPFDALMQTFEQKAMATLVQPNIPAVPATSEKLATAAPKP